MNRSLRSLLALALLLPAGHRALAQTVPPAAPAAPADTARIALPASLFTPVSLQSYEAFRVAVQPLVQQMASKKVVALGEGTHGTAEFYRVRFWLTRLLVEEHGFTHVALENSYGDTYQLNQALQLPDAELTPALRKSLLSIWQNQEMAQVFAWLRTYNRTHRRRVTLAGVDAMFGSATADLLQKGLATAGHEVQALTAQLVKSAQYKDAAWLHYNDPTYKGSRKELRVMALAGYDAADKLLQVLPTLKLPRRERPALLAAATNARLAFDDFHQAVVNKRESSRDSVLAAMTQVLVREPGQKLILWAHDAHVARRGVVPGDNNGGGTGAFLERLLPGQYFALATATAGGTFAATTQNFISPASPMDAYPLAPAKAGSWEASLAHAGSPDFYFFTRQLGSLDRERPLRLVGYTLGSETFYAPLKLASAFDAVLFLRQTTAATPLR